MHTRRPTERQTAVDGMLQEVEVSTAILLPAAEQVYCKNLRRESSLPCHTSHQLGRPGIDTLSENRWSRRDCTEYQEELDWVMRTFRRVCDEFDILSLLA